VQLSGLIENNDRGLASWPDPECDEDELKRLLVGVQRLGVGLKLHVGAQCGDQIVYFPTSIKRLGIDVGLQ
jgi:hypothetical protein